MQQGIERFFFDSAYRNRAESFIQHAELCENEGAAAKNLCILQRKGEGERHLAHSL